MSTLKLNLSYSNSVLNISHSHAINQVNSYVLVFLIKPQLDLNTIATLNFNQHCVRRLENLRFQIHLLKNDLPTLEQGPNCCNMQCLSCALLMHIFSSVYRYQE